MLSNVKKSTYNIITSVLSQFITIVLGIIIPRLVLLNIGSESNGLLSTVNQMLSYASLLEAGVGLASLQALYGPVAREDRYSINSIMAATDAYYKKTGKLYFITVILLAVAYPFTIKPTTITRTTVVVVIIISGMPGVINYYFQGKYKILLQAEGKSYIITNLTTITSIFVSFGKIVLLLLGYGVVAVQSLYFVISLAQMTYISYYMKKHCAWLDLSVKPNYDRLSQKNSVFIHQLSGMVFGNTDAIILSIFCGLSVVSVYSMYAMLFGMVGTLLSNLGGSITFVLGQQASSDMERYTKTQNAFELVYISLSFSLLFVAMTFVIPFLTLYTSGVSDIVYINKYLPFLFVAIALLENSRLSSAKAIQIAGHFKQTQWHAITEMIINIVVSIVFVLICGIYGALIGTIAALLFRANAMISYANKKILHQSPWKTYRRWLVNLVLFVVITLASKPIFTYIALDTYPKIILWAAISCVVVIPLFLVVASLFDRETYHYAKELVVPYLKQMWNKLIGHSKTQE